MYNPQLPRGLTSTLKEDQASMDSYLDDALAGCKRQPHQTGVIDGHYLVADTEFSRASRRAAVLHPGQDDGGEDGAPAGLYDHHAEALPLLLVHVHLQHEECFLVIHQTLYFIT